MRDLLTPGDPEVALGLAADEQEVAARATVDRALAEVRLDPVVARAGRDRVRAVAGVDEVACGAADDRVDLVPRLVRGLVVGPQDVPPRPAVERVVAVAAEQLVVPRRARDDEAGRRV